MSLCIVGTRWGYFLGTELRRIYSGKLLVCGREPGRTQRIARNLGADDYVVGWETAVRDPAISAIIIALPPQMHCAAAKAALLAGKHVLVEKPLATSLEECDEIIDAARQTGVVLAGGENIPYRPALRRAKQLLADVGEPRLFIASSLHTASCSNNRSVGILLDVCVHYIRAVRYLFGEPDAVFASRAEQLVRQQPGDDNVTLLLSSRAGWQATLSFSWQASAGVCPEFILAGNRGALKIWPESTTVDVYPVKRTALTRIISGVRPEWLREKLQSPETQRRRIRLPRHDRMGYQAELQEFLNAVAAGKPNVSSAEEARRDLEIVMAAYSSLTSGASADCSVETQSPAAVTQVTSPRTAGPLPVFARRIAQSR